MNIKMEFTATETLLILQSLGMTCLDESVNEIDRKIAERLRDKIDGFVKESFREK